MSSSWCPQEQQQQLYWLTVTCLPRASAAQAPSENYIILIISTGSQHGGAASPTDGRGHSVTCSRSMGWSLAGLGFEASPSDCPPQLPFPSRMASHTYQLPPDLG